MRSSVYGGKSMMGPDHNLNIEQIARMVIQRLTDSGLLSTSNPAPSATVALNDLVPVRNKAEIIIPGQVVSLKEIKDKLDGINKIQVSASALLTPAVKDELRSRGVSVVRISDSVPKEGFSHGFDGRNGQLRLHVFMPDNKSINWHGWGKANCFLNLQVTDSKQPVAYTVKKIISDWQNTDRVILCTTQPYAALIELAKSGVQCGIRSLTVYEPGELIRAVSEANPNLLVLDERRWSAHQVFNLSKSWMLDSQDCKSSLQGR
jgi:hypothetical protein